MFLLPMIVQHVLYALNVVPTILVALYCLTNQIDVKSAVMASRFRLYRDSDRE